MVVKSIETSNVNKKIKYQNRQSIFSRLLPKNRSLKSSCLAVDID